MRLPTKLTLYPGKKAESRERCWPTWGPPLITRKLVARNRPMPSTRPKEMPQALALSTSNPSRTVSSGVGLMRGSLDVVEEIAGLLDLGAGADQERRDGKGEGAAEGDEPAGHERDDEAPSHPDGDPWPADRVAREVLTKEPKRKVTCARTHQADDGEHAHEQGPRGAGGHPECGLVQPG